MQEDVTNVRHQTVEGGGEGAEAGVVRGVLELELVVAEAAGRCVKSVSEGVQCGCMGHY